MKPEELYSLLLVEHGYYAVDAEMSKNIGVSIVLLFSGFNTTDIYMNW